MSRRLALATLVLPWLCACVQLPARRVSLYGAQRALDSSVWEPADQQLTYGIETDTWRPDTGWGVEFGYLHSDGSDTTFVLGLGNVKAETSSEELFVGARKNFGGGEGMQSYVGSGLTWIDSDFKASTSNDSISDSSSNLAVYLHGGVLWPAWRGGLIGLDYRQVLFAEADMFGAQGNSEYGQLSLIFAFGF